MHCRSDKQPSADPLPPEPKRNEIAGQTGPAQLQVIPYDVLLKPGGEQQFHFRLFDANGQFLR